MVSLKQQTVSGVKWLVVSNVIQKLLSICGTVILARILDPAIFGVFALACVIIEALGLFQSMGFDSALIQRKNDITKAANTAFLIVPILGLFLCFMLIVSAPTIGKIMNNGSLIAVIKILGIGFLISCLSRIPTVLLEKNMQFKIIAIIELSTQIVYSVIAVILALRGMGVWSLVIGYVIKIIIQNIFVFAFSSWRPNLEFDTKLAWEMFNYGKFLFLGGIVWFLRMNLDNLMVGKLLGVAALGAYALAFNISNFSATYVGSKIGKVIFPAFSKIQSNIFDLKHYFLKSTKIISILAFPICFGLIIFADEIIKILYGPKWLSAIPVLKVLAVTGLLNTITIPIGAFFNATGRSKAGFFFSAIQVIIFSVFIFPAAKWYGLVGVGALVAISQIFAISVYLPFTMKWLSITIKDFYLSLKLGLVASLVTGITISIFKLALINIPNYFSVFFYLKTIVLILATVWFYIFLLRRNDKDFIYEVRGMLLNR